MEYKLITNIEEGKRDALRLKLKEWKSFGQHRNVDVPGIPEDAREGTLLELDAWYSEKRGKELIKEKADQVSGKAPNPFKNGRINKQIEESQKS